MPPRRRPAALGLKIDTPASGLGLGAAVPGPESAYESEPPSASGGEPTSEKPSRRNRKGLSLGLPSAQSSTSSLAPSIAPSVAPSVVSQRSLASGRLSAKRKTVRQAYPTWMVRSKSSLAGISAILNVAKEVKPPGSIPSSLDYLQLTWSHGQQHLVDDGFPAAFAFVDSALNRKSGVLVHCQCGISRSSTVIIALVMRWAAEQSSLVPADVWTLKGMSGAYDYVKERSKWIGPNMSFWNMKGVSTQTLLHLASLSRKKRNGAVSADFSMKAPSPLPDEEENHLVMQEARALDKAMEDRILARKSSRSSVSSIASSTGSGVGMGSAWRSKYASRKRTSSIASSTISEDLMEEDEDALVTGFTDSDRSAYQFITQSWTASRLYAPASTIRSSIQEVVRNSQTSLLHRQEKALVSLNLRLPQLARPSTSPLPLLLMQRLKGDVGRWLLMFSPLSPLLQCTLLCNQLMGIPPLFLSLPGTRARVQKSLNGKPFIRNRTESRKPAPPPLHLRHSMVKQANRTHKRSISAASSVSAASSAASSTSTSIVLNTPSQTLFVFPPSPDAASGMPSKTPSAMTLTSNGVPFPTSATPRVSTFRAQGRTKSFIGLTAPPTPTTAFSRVDARGFVLGKHD
ncbi:dual specificity phosphatase [Flagelloscypha sp. PMI_526]|nr:dual specificity phosphatase [Flagelloscypha sp. PMI_526]